MEWPIEYEISFPLIPGGPELQIALDLRCFLQGCCAVNQAFNDCFALATLLEPITVVLCLECLKLPFDDPNSSCDELRTDVCTGISDCPCFLCDAVADLFVKCNTESLCGNFTCSE